MVLTADDTTSIAQIVQQVTRLTAQANRGQERDEGSWGRKEVLDAKKMTLATRKTPQIGLIWRGASFEIPFELENFVTL